MWKSGGIAPPFLISALDGGEWSASRPCRFTPGKEHSVPIGLSPRVGLDAVEERKILHWRESNPGRPARSYTDWAIPRFVILWLPATLLPTYLTDVNPFCAVSDIQDVPWLHVITSGGDSWGNSVRILKTNSLKSSHISNIHNSWQWDHRPKWSNCLLNSEWVRI
jgi:hypothetical protein